MAKKQAQVTDVKVAEAVIAHEAVDCFCGTEQKKSPQPKRLVSCTGGVFWGKVGETWPRTADGVPLFPWLQIVCTEMDRLYGAFYGRQAACFYLREDFSDYDALSTPDGGDFVVREYEKGDKLKPLARPKELKRHPFRRVVWKRLQDYPSLSKYYELFDDEVYSALCDTKNFKYGNRAGIKIGGWPTPVQRDQEYPGSHDLQIDMTENYMYFDSGIAHLSRDGGQWYVAFETC